MPSGIQTCLRCVVQGSSSHSITCICAITPQVVIQRADPTIAEETSAALWQSASSSTRMAGAIHAAGTQVHACNCGRRRECPVRC